MTDLEITKLCAEAMWFSDGWNEHRKGLVFLAADYSAYDPLHDDSQAMALVKRYPHECLEAMKRELITPPVLPNKRLLRATDLNRAICECVARIQKAKACTT